MVRIFNRRFFSIVVITLLLISGIYKGAHYFWGEHYVTFFKGIVRNPSQVGAVTPASVFVAHEITSPIRNYPKDTPLRVLEVGGGSGIFTTAIEAALADHSGDYTVDVVEIDPEYCAVLEERFKSNKHIAIHCENILNFNADEPYHIIVSSLPFNTLDTNLVRHILQKYQQLVVSGGSISFVEHMWFPSLTELLKRGEDKKDFRTRRALIKEFRESYPHDVVSVYANISPMYVYHLTIS